MATARALGLLTSDPQRCHVALTALSGLLELPVDSDGAGIGSCVDAAALLTRKPTLPRSATLAQLVGPQKGRTAVVQLRVKSDVRPSTESPNNLGPWRMKDYACAVIGGPTSADHAGTLRDKLLGELPDFLHRSVRGQTEGEAFFFAVLAALHEKGVLERAPRADMVAEAVRAVVKRTDDLPRHVVIANGTTLLFVSHEMTTGIVRMEGLDEEIATSLEPTLADSSLARDRLKRFRGIFTAGGLDVPLERAGERPAGVQLMGLPDTCAVEVGRNFEPRQV